MKIINTSYYFYFLMKFIYSSQREYYIAEAYIEYGYHIKFQELNIINYSLLKDKEGGENYQIIEYRIVNRIFADDKKYFLGWNTTYYFGELDSYYEILL